MYYEFKYLKVRILEVTNNPIIFFIFLLNFEFKIINIILFFKTIIIIFNYFILGISGISNLSCSSSMYLTTKIKTKELSLNKILEALAKCEESIYQVAHRKLIYKSLENLIADDNNFKPELLDKLKQIILVNKINKYLVLPNDSNEKFTLLGLMETTKPEFSCEERKLIKLAVETEVLKSINSFISK